MSFDRGLLKDRLRDKFNITLSVVLACERLRREADDAGRSTSEASEGRSKVLVEVLQEIYELVDEIPPHGDTVLEDAIHRVNGEPAKDDLPSAESLPRRIGPEGLREGDVFALVERNKIDDVSSMDVFPGIVKEVDREWGFVRRLGDGDLVYGKDVDEDHIQHWYLLEREGSPE